MSVANHKIGLNSGIFEIGHDVGRHDILVILVHLIVTVVRLIKPGGLHAVVAESAFTRYQIVILNRSRKRAGAFPIA